MQWILVWFRKLNSFKIMHVTLWRCFMWKTHVRFISLGLSHDRKHEISETNVFFLSRVHFIQLHVVSFLALKQAQTVFKMDRPLDGEMKKKTEDLNRWTRPKHTYEMKPWFSWNWLFQTPCLNWKLAMNDVELKKSINVSRSVNGWGCAQHSINKFHMSIVNVWPVLVCQSKTLNIVPSAFLFCARTRSQRKHTRHRHQLAVQFKVIEHAFGVMKLNFLFRMNSQRNFQSKCERNE